MSVYTMFMLTTTLEIFSDETLNTRFCQTWCSVENEGAENLPQMVNWLSWWTEELTSSTLDPFTGGWPVLRGVAR